MSPKDKRLLSSIFDHIHEELAIIKAVVEETDDPEAMTLYQRMDMDTLYAMSKLRHHLDVPFSWREGILYREYEPFSVDK